LPRGRCGSAGWPGRSHRPTASPASKRTADFRVEMATAAPAAAILVDRASRPAWRRGSWASAMRGRRPGRRLAPTRLQWRRETQTQIVFDRRPGRRARKISRRGTHRFDKIAISLRSIGQVRGRARGIRPRFATWRALATRTRRRSASRRIRRMGVCRPNGRPRR
jgi:hypothetical protein